MSNIIIPSERDPIKRGKDCLNFVPMKDGTKTGDSRFCDLSFACKQIGYYSEYVQFVDWKTGEVLEHDYLCTGMKTTSEDKGVDEEAH